MLSEKKAWYSWTIIFNVLTIIGVVLASLVTQEVFPPQAMKWVVVAQAFINTALRFKTTEPIAIK